jgi:hypothetical protein
MYDDLRPIVEELINQFPKSYVHKLKKQYPQFVNYLGTLPYSSVGECLYNWVYPNAKNTCIVCQNSCAFKQFSRGYYDYCSVSCKAKHLKAHKNAHTADGKCKGILQIKRSAAKAVEKRKQTILDTQGVSLGEYSTKKRQASYMESLPKELLDADFCAKSQKSVTSLAKELNVPFVTVRNAFKRHGIQPLKKRCGFSSQELEVCAFLDKMNVDYVRNVRDKLVGKQEIDIFIPSLNVGIEYCGLFWHSDRNHYSAKKHQDKFIAAATQGIKLITIFEDEWLFNSDIVKSRLRSILQQHTVKVFARKCTVSPIPGPIVAKHLDDWHIAGAKSSNSNLCLLYNGEVVAVITYGKPRYNKQVDLEIIRYATKPGMTVVGGFSKLFTHVINKTGSRCVVSYSDNRWGTGSVYQHAGFVNDGITAPSYYYFMVKDRIRYHRSLFMKHKILQSMGGNPDMTEIANMRAFGYNRIFDCGTTRWIWKDSSVI